MGAGCPCGRSELEDPGWFDLYIFGGPQTCDLWKYDTLTNQWSIVRHGRATSYGILGVPDPSNIPPTRTGAASWTGADGALYLFGGSSVSSSGYLSDLWRSTVTSQWTWLKGGRNADDYGIYGVQGSSAPGSVPGSRYGAACWTGADGALYLFGGYGYAAYGLSGYLGDLWRYDVTTNQWTWLKGSNCVGAGVVYGSQGVPAADNTPGSRLERQLRGQERMAASTCSGVIVGRHGVICGVMILARINGRG